MTWTIAGPIIVAVIAASGALAAKRQSRQDRTKTAVDIIGQVNVELRTELARAHQDRDEEVERLRAEVTSLRSDLRLARDEIRGAHETTGRAMRRVEHLETILRDHGILFNPGPLV